MRQDCGAGAAAIGQPRVTARCFRRGAAASAPRAAGRAAFARGGSRPNVHPSPLVIFCLALQARSIPPRLRGGWPAAGRPGGVNEIVRKPRWVFTCCDPGRARRSKPDRRVETIGAALHRNTPPGRLRRPPSPSGRDKRSTPRLSEFTHERRGAGWRAVALT